jgi:tetratricopeptide (TPR) repeat protein
MKIVFCPSVILKAIALLFLITISTSTLWTVASAEDENVPENQEIEKQVQEAFDLELSSLKNRIEKAEIDLKRIRSEFELRSKNREKIVASRIQHILTGNGTQESNLDAPSAARLGAKGWQAWNEQRFSDAIDAFEIAFKSDPKNVAVLNGLGWSYISIGEYEEALKYLKLARELEPNHPGVLNGIGQAATQLKRYDEAEEVLLATVNGSIKDQGEDVYAKGQANAAWFSLIQLYIASGKQDKAMDWTERFLKHNPKNPIMLQMKERIEAIKGK